MTIYSFYRSLSEQHEIITAEKIKKLYTQTGMYPKTLLSLFRKHNEDALKLVGHGRAMVTCKKYNLAYRRVKEFLIDQYGKDDIYLDNLNLQFINDYEVYLRVNCKLGVNMAAKMIQLLKKS